MTLAFEKEKLELETDLHLSKEKVLKLKDVCKELEFKVK